MTVPPNASAGAIPTWRREPYRVLVPLGVLLAWAGVLHWLLLATGVIEEYRSIFHAFAQIEGFMAARVPNSFVWVVLALVMGMGGSILAGVGAALGEDRFWLHEVGRNLVLQGMFTGLVLGIGGFLLPVITRGAQPLEPATVSPRAAALHLVAGLTFIGSFFVEALVSMQLGFALRAAIVLVVLLTSAEIFRLPSVRGLHRRLIWLAVWLLPVGYASVAVFPQYQKAGLHVVFIGCFALLALCISIHVALSHGGAPALLNGSPWPVALLGALLLCSLVLRVLVNVDPPNVYRWLGSAAAAFLAGTIVWALFLARSLRSSRA